MAFSLEKMSLFQPLLKYLGFEIKRGLITKGGKYRLFFDQFNPQHIIKDKIIFKTKREVQKLLEFVNWNGLFVPSLSALVEPFQALLSKNPPYSVDGAEKLYKLEEAIKLDIRLSQPKSDWSFYIFTQTNDTNLAGCIYQRDEEGRLSVMTMVNHKFKDQILAKGMDIKEFYSIYYVLKRYKDLLFGRPIKIAKEVGTILSPHKDSTYLSPLLGKWLVFLNCFSLSDIEEPIQPKKLIDFLIKYHMVPGIYDSRSPEELFEGEETTKAEEWPKPDHLLTLRTPVSLKDTEYAETIDSIIKNIEEHQANDNFCAKITRALKQNKHDKNHELFELEGMKLHRKVDGNKLLVLPRHMLSDIILTIHELYMHPGINKTLIVLQRHFWVNTLDTTARDLINKCYRCKTSKITNQKIIVTPMHIPPGMPVKWCVSTFTTPCLNAREETWHYLWP